MNEPDRIGNVDWRGNVGSWRSRIPMSETGADPDPRDCPTCDGAGVIVTNPGTYLHNPAALRDVPCADCDGTGYDHGGGAA